MAPKRAAKKAAPPPPPPPPAESSDETRSGSRSRSEESDGEDATAESPVPAATPTIKNKGGESESSDEEEEEDGEEEEEPAPAAPKNQPPPPQKKEESEASGDEDEEDDEEEGEDDDEQGEEEPIPAAPPSAQKNQPPQPQNKDDSDTSGDEEEDEDDDEAPPPKPAAEKEVEAPEPAAAAETKQPGGFKRIWSTDDEVRILEALAAHQEQHGAFPQPDALVELLAGKLDNPAYGSKELQSKVQSLRARYLTLSKRAEVPSREHDRRLLDLSKLVWAGTKASPVAADAGTAAANGREGKGFEEMCELYPFLAEEVKQLEAALPGMCKREFGKMDDDKARAMDEKIKKQRVMQIKAEMRSADLVKELTKTLIDLVDA